MVAIKMKTLAGKEFWARCASAPQLGEKLHIPNGKHKGKYTVMAVKEINKDEFEAHVT